VSAHETKWLRFELASEQKPKTSVWRLVTKDNIKNHIGSEIGQVRWFGPWRGYAFFPVGGTVFEQTCLRDIAAFCEQRTKEHRALSRAQHSELSTQHCLP